MMLQEPTGQGWTQVVELAIALVLSAMIGWERELRQKSAGLRTHTLIGFGAALIMLVSKYGFTDVLGDHVVLDPSRVAAQIVSGIGFIGGGLIFVRRDAVRGLTTAAAVWVTTAVGMAAGGGLPVLAAVSTLGYFLVVYGLGWLAMIVKRSRPQSRLVEIVYEDGRGLLRTILAVCTSKGWVVERLSSRSAEPSSRWEGRLARPLVAHTDERPIQEHDPMLVAVVVGLSGKGSHDEIAAALAEVDGVLLVTSAEPDSDWDTSAD
jgi:putative Mg2+ transporter-C (MgtC) family protein